MSVPYAIIIYAKVVKERINTVILLIILLFAYETKHKGLRIKTIGL